MDVTFRTRNLEKCFFSKQKAIKEWGPAAGQKVAQRFKEIQAAPSLKILGMLPHLHLHPLKGKRKGQYAITVIGLLRIILEPKHIPMPKLETSGIDLSKVTHITILEVVDYHD